MALTKKGDEEQDMEKVYIGELPVMLKSNICHLNGLTEDEIEDVGEDPQVSWRIFYSQWIRKGYCNYGRDRT